MPCTRHARAGVYHHLLTGYCRFQLPRPGPLGTAERQPLGLHQGPLAPSPCASWPPCPAADHPSQSHPQRAWSAPSCACAQLAASLQQCTVMTCSASTVRCFDHHATPICGSVNQALQIYCTKTSKRGKVKDAFYNEQPHGVGAAVHQIECKSITL